MIIAKIQQLQTVPFCREAAFLNLISYYSPYIVVQNVDNFVRANTNPNTTECIRWCV